MMSTPAVFLWILSVGYTVALPTMPCGKNVDKKFIPDTNDCSIYYICSRGVSIMHSCGENGAFYGHKCFPKFSKYDLCNKYRVEAFSPRLKLRQEPFRTSCQPGERGIFPHPFHCALYYNCSDHSQNLRKPFLKECPSPLLFDEIAMDCMKETQVDCGPQRKKPSGQCDYLGNQCLTSHGMPCGVLMPSCQGLPDGMNAWTDKPQSPHYIECKNDGLVGKFMCGSISLFGREIQTIFTPRNGWCSIP